MEDWRAFFKGKKITVMGLGLLGRGVGDAAFLAECGADLIITDLKSEAELAPSLKKLEKFSGITYRLGGHDKADFRGRDFILKAAGVRQDSPFLIEAKQNDVPIKMSASWFAELSGIPILGVTGTRGKSTVTHLLFEIVKSSGAHALLGGNVRDVSTLALLKETKPDSVGVFELDSWQCQGFGDAKMSPHISVFTTLYPDHQNYYSDMESYLADKALIFLNQTADDTLILGSPASLKILETYGPRIKSRVIVADPAHFPSGWAIQIPGTHNLLNAACAIEAARALGISDEVIRKAVAAFKGVPGRLELIKEVNGVQIYNDTTSTTPESTIAALHSLPGERVVLIMGGADKGLDMKELASLVPAYTKKVILLKGTGTDRLLKDCPECFPDAPVYDNLEAAFKDAMQSATKGDIVLLSPAFASFGMFKNEFDRGDTFAALARPL
jgi:UDP-N-acetylmuramoylalanine--D-glutamate ligase